MDKAIPEDLAVALLAPMMRDDPAGVTLVAGHYSADFPTHLAPDGFVSLGALGGEWGSVNVAVTQLGAEEALSAMEAKLKSAGWTVLAETPPMSGGFISRSESHSRPYCNADGACISITTRPRASEGSYGQWTFTKQDSPYNARKHAASRMHPMADIPMPTLKKPPDVSLQTSQGMSASSDHRVAYATAITTLSLGDLLQSYAEQVQNAGWKAYPATIGEFGAVQSFDMTDPDGKNWRGLLAVVDNGADRAVLFRVNLASGGVIR